MRKKSNGIVRKLRGQMKPKTQEEWGYLLIAIALVIFFINGDIAALFNYMSSYIPDPCEQVGSKCL